MANVDEKRGRRVVDGNLGMGVSLSPTAPLGACTQYIPYRDDIMFKCIMQTRKLSIHTFSFCFNARYPCQRNNATKLQKQHPIPVKDAWYPIGID